MALKAYYDGSGKAHNRADAFLTLAGLAGDAKAWEIFDEQWRKILANRDPAAHYLHMKEANPLRKEFSETKGWDNDKVRSLLADLTNECFFKATFSDSASEQLGIFSCTVDLTAYRKLQDEGRTLTKEEHICTDGAVALMLNILGSGSSERIEMYFDRDEQFRGRVENIWNRKRRPAWWAKRVDTVAPVNMKCWPGIQAADFIAWSLNRKYTVNDKPLSSMIHGLMARKVHVFVGREALLKQYVKV